MSYAVAYRLLPYIWKSQYTVMAESESKQPGELAMVEENEKKLKYLEFVQVTAVYAVVCSSTLYEFAKDNSGPLRPGVQNVEATVKAVVRPVYEKFHDVPFELLRFVDRKVEESVSEVEKYVPSLLKQASSQARAMAGEVQRAGVVDAAKQASMAVYRKYEPTVRELYMQYEPVAEQYAVSTWRLLNRVPMFPQVAQIAVPTAAYWADRYNQVVCNAADKGYSLALYMPLIPVERIGKVFDEDGNGNGGGFANGEASMAQ